MALRGEFWVKSDLEHKLTWLDSRNTAWGFFSNWAIKCPVPCSPGLSGCDPDHAVSGRPGVPPHQPRRSSEAALLLPHSRALPGSTSSAAKSRHSGDTGPIREGNIPTRGSIRVISRPTHGNSAPQSEAPQVSVPLELKSRSCESSVNRPRRVRGCIPVPLGIAPDSNREPQGQPSVGQSAQAVQAECGVGLKAPQGPLAQASLPDTTPAGTSAPPTSVSGACLRGCRGHVT